MAGDEQLVARVRASLVQERQVAEKTMFGRRMFMVAGHLAVGVAGDELMVRVGREDVRSAVADPHARPCVMSGRPMADWILVAPDGLLGDDGLDAWVARGVAFARGRMNG
ncbi:MAG: TfoX/Sxy family protein [Solirubrobacteraceae bacterium]|nr:TfoX/Sxy family protein [Solirubrobacteraceae bacterium]